MGDDFHILFFLLTATTIINLRLISAATSPLPPSPTSTPSSSPVDQQQQLNNIIDALIGAGDFASWANIISAADPLTLPMSATLFIPSDNALTTTTTNPVPINFDPFIVPYHIVPQRLSFSDLQLFHINSRLPTLLPNNSILITNNSRSNFTLNDSPITHPDLYLNAVVSVHGIATILHYSLYGDPLSPPQHQLAKPSPPGLLTPPTSFPTVGEIMGRRRSDAACLCTEFPIVFSVVCAAFAFKIHRNALTTR